MNSEGSGEPAHPRSLTRAFAVPSRNLWATSWENLLMPYAKIKGPDQPAHLRSLISTCVVCCLDSIIPLVSIPKISRLASLCSWAGWFESYLVLDPEDRFSCDVAYLELEASDKEPHTRPFCAYAHACVFEGFKKCMTLRLPFSWVYSNALYWGLHIIYEPRHEKTCLRGLRPVNSNWPAQLMRQARVLKFRL